MTGNSPGRRAAKRLLVRAMSERMYSCVQALVMALDICLGRLSEPELRLVPIAVRAGDAVVDIGANYGLYSYHLSRAVGPTGHVYAFEPIAFTYRTLRLVSRILRLRNIEIFAKGCGERSGPCVFTVPLQDSGAIAAGLAHLRSDASPAAGEPVAGCSGTREIAGELVALDDVLRPHGELTFVKCDIEGAELFAFRGLRRTIETHRPTVLCEVEQRYLDRFAIRREELLGFFAERGYRCFVLQDGALREPLDAGATDGNLVFVHPTRRDRLRPLLDRAPQGPPATGPRP